jgi:uncharacterized protein
MRCKIKDIGENGLDLRVPVSQSWLDTECAEPSLRIAQSGLVLEGRIEPAGQGYLLRATLRGELSVPCARCLEPASVAIDVPMAVSFVEEPAHSEQDPDEAQDDVVSFHHGVIDLSGPVRDEILLAAPMRAVCRPDCAGICPTCGRNRNVTPCDCPNDGSEAGKFAALAKIKLQ